MLLRSVTPLKARVEILTAAMPSRPSRERAVIWRYFPMRGYGLSKLPLVKWLFSLLPHALDGRGR